MPNWKMTLSLVVAVALLCCMQPVTAQLAGTESSYEVTLVSGVTHKCKRARTDNGGTLFVETEEGRVLAFSSGTWLQLETLSSK